MKTKIKFISRKIIKKSATIIVVSLFVLCTGETHAQFQPESSLINIPNQTGGGSLTGDIIYADGKIFAYSPDSISVYNADTAGYIGKVHLSNWGKFNPVYFNADFWPGEFNAMEYNQTSGMLYAITPNLHLKVINTSNISESWDISLDVLDIQFPGSEDLEDLLETLNGRLVMKYDSNHERLYILVSARDPEYILNCPGNFHTRRGFFGIYNVDNSIDPDVAGYLSLHYNEIYDIDLPQYIYEDQINNFEFNTKQGQDYFYITRFSRFEIWKIPDTIGTVDTLYKKYVDTSYFDSYYKFGKMLYINNSQLHKIVIVPYRFGTVSSTFGYVFIINGDHSDTIVPNDIKEFYAPSKRVLDVVYLESSNDLIMSYAPDNDVQYYDSVVPNSDIAIYQYNNTTDEFSYLNSYITNQPADTSVYDINSSIQMLVVTPTDTLDQPNTVLIGKKDQIVKLVYNESTTNYEQPSELLEAENNIFRNGASGDGNSYIINSTAGKLEIFDNINFTHDFIKTGHPVYHITANANGNNLYLYNKLNVDNTGIYSYNTETETTTFLSFDKPIGDCIYNPFQDHFLISKLESDSAKIVIYNASTNVKIGEIDLGQYEQFAKEMFISPDGKLYVMANMHYTLIPKIFIFDATDPDYSPIANPLSVTGLTCEDDFIYYTAHFCSNPINEDPEVYVSICPQEKKSPPYNTETNRMYDFYEANAPNYGKLLRLDDGIIFQDTIKFPGKVIYPDRSQFGGNSQYDGKVFIIGKYLSVYNTSTNLVSNLGHYDFIDITYNSFNDKLFAFTNTPHDTCEEDRSCVIWTIEIDTSGIPIISEYNIDPIPGQAASFFSNPYNGKVYLHQKVDNKKLGDSLVSLHSFDPSDESPLWHTTPLGITSFSPEYDQTLDPSKAQFYNITTPYINPYTNHIYLPNGGHSCMSRVTFEPKELLLLRSGWTWLSFPRLKERDTNGNVDAIEVLNGNIQPENYYYAYMEHLEINQYGANLIDIKYQNQQWDVSGGLEYVNSTKGYKLKLDEPEERTISLFGTVLDPSTQMNLYAGYANWIGYFPIQTMTVSEAFASIWDNISEIRHQDWAIANPSGNQPPVPDYMLNFTLSYGDMVIVKVFDTCTFYWPSCSNPETPLSAPETNYFSYEEKADYTPFYIEMNPDSIPVEIAVYEDTICVGAAVVQDSIIEINAYLTDSLGYNPGISFISHYGLKAAGKTVKKYNVYNFKTNRMESRIIHSKDKADYYYISLKGGKITNEPESNPVSISCAPNPLKNEVTIKFTVQQECMLQIVVYDLYGKSLNILQQSVSKAGNYSINWTGTDSNGKPLPNGVYILKLKAGTNYAQTKIIIIK